MKEITTYSEVYSALKKVYQVINENPSPEVTKVDEALKNFEGLLTAYKNQESEILKDLSDIAYSIPHYKKKQSTEALKRKLGELETLMEE